MSSKIAIPNFTADDYASSEKPYAWLYEQKGNPFLHRQLLEKMRKEAGSFGVRSFVSLYKDYCNGVSGKDDASSGRSTEFAGQPIELVSGAYLCDENGVRTIDRFGYEEVICPHPIMPVRRLTNVDTGEERIEIAFRRGRGAWKTVIVEKTVVSSSSRILELSANGIVVNSDNAKTLSKYLFNIEDANYEHIPERTSVGRLGWIGNHGFSPYIDGLEFDGENTYRHLFSSVTSIGSRDEWVDAMRKVRAEKTVGRIVLAASFASAIVEPCGLLPFFVHLWGGSETGKTVALMIAASVWGNPRVGSFITTFNATQVGMEMTAAFLNSLPMCVDELQIQSSAGIKDFDRILYYLAEGAGRTRGAKTGGLQRQGTWKNCIITNGEHPISNPNSGGGAVNRVIEIETSIPICSNLPDVSDAVKKNYGFAGKEFAEYLQKPGVLDEITELQQVFFQNLLCSDVTDKQAGSASAILAADAIVTELIFQDDNALSVDDISEFLAKKEDININKKALDYAYELFARNPTRFSPNEYGEYKSEVWGKADNSFIYFVKSVFDRELSAAGYNPTSFLSWAQRSGYLVCDKDRNRRTKKARINNVPVNTVCLTRKFEQSERFETEIDSSFDDLPV